MPARAKNWLVEGFSTADLELDNLGVIISILVHFFAVYIFVEAGLSAKITKICTQRKFPAVRYLCGQMALVLEWEKLVSSLKGVFIREAP